MTRSECGRAVGGAAIKSRARGSARPEGPDCPRRVPGASRIWGEGEGCGPASKPSVTAGVTRKDQNDKEEAGGRRSRVGLPGPHITRGFHTRMEEKCERQT